jgi:ADP-heptose:LPS heptosyltransferase
MPLQHILIIHQGALGDLIVSLPCFYAIRAAFPEAVIEVMGYPRYLSLVDKRFYADAVCSVDRADMASLYSEHGVLNPDLVAYFKKFEKIFYFGRNARKTVLQKIAELHSPELFHIKTFPENADKHVIDFQLEQLPSLAYNTAGATPRIFLLDEDRREAQIFLMQRAGHAGNRPLIAIHPGSGSAKKNWPVRHYAALVHSLYSITQGIFILIEGPADEQPVAQFKKELGDVSAVMLQTPALPVLAAIIKQCALYMGNDGGITHLAAAAGIPVVAIFGPSDSRIWGPRGEKVSIIDRAEGTWASPAAVLDVVLTTLAKKQFPALIRACPTGLEP